ncbi:MAG: hypothetical protein DRP02_04560 [Candidatus Gerdarchaeota archaeon]|nr:MAG: hypothetical protein DRP02_04560 [Candidatus Gerdarchaeota archaeon]
MLDEVAFFIFISAFLLSLLSLFSLTCEERKQRKAYGIKFSRIGLNSICKKVMLQQSNTLYEIIF